tara:strand:- start:343 stop:561 length:219 start_codon:yes stop_codon:yes gene_type:complete
MQITKARLKEIIKEELENMQAPEEAPQQPSPNSYRGFTFEIPREGEDGDMLSEEAKTLYVTKIQDVIDSFYV